MRTFGLAIAGLLSATVLLAADAQQDLSQDRADEIIQKFAAKEAEFSQARENYTYKQTARVQTLDPGGASTGKWETVSDITFNPVDGKRMEHVTYSPVSTLSEVTLTPEDMEDLKSVQPFVLTTAELPKYLIRYLGRQKVDEIGCYVFAVKPKKMDPGQRYFEGEVWVDDRDLQIVKSYGRGVGKLKRNEDQQFPKFETYREQIDGKYWFPTYTIANDTLHFKDNDVRLKQTVRYDDYKQFKAKSSITFGGEADSKDPKKP
jgi:outer membrane lipoprotein-sorting protein